jgi:glutamate carboxypeptidase
MNPIRRLRRARPTFGAKSKIANGGGFRTVDQKVQSASEALLEEMVNIDSTTNNIKGVNRVQAIVARELIQMGFEIQLTTNPDPAVSSGELLVATLTGQSSEYVTLVSHADTVLSRDVCGVFERLPGGIHARGSGVIDNKGGLVVALMGLRTFLGKLGLGGRPQFSIRFVCSPNEEAGSQGLHEFFRACSLDSRLVLGFEPALENGSIIESRRGNRWYQIMIEGEEAHAGRCRGEQINAAHDLAMKISRLHRLNNPKTGVSVNIGHLQGGRDRFNVVCGAATAKLDARFPSFETREKLHRQIDRILTAAHVHSPITGRATIASYTIADDCPPFSSTSASRSLLKSYLKVASRLEGRRIVAEKAGGAGDVNYMSREGVIVLDGFGPVGGKMHTTEEFVHLPTLSTRTLALAEFFKVIGPRFSDHRQPRAGLKSAMQAT